MNVKERGGYCLAMRPLLRRLRHRSFEYFALFPLFARPRIVAVACAGARRAAASVCVSTIGSGTASEDRRRIAGRKTVGQFGIEPAIIFRSLLIPLSRSVGLFRPGRLPIAHPTSRALIVHNSSLSVIRKEVPAQVLNGTPIAMTLSSCARQP